MVTYTTPVSSSNTWGYWAGSDSTSANITWNAWSSSTSTTSADGSTPAKCAAPRPLTAEENQAIEQRRAQDRIEYEQQAAERRQAEDRADTLLRSLLTDEQRGMLEQQMAILVRTESKRLYRIKNTGFVPVEELDENGRAIAAYCIQPPYGLPVADKVLAKMLLLQADEAAFLEIARRTQL